MRNRCVEPAFCAQNFLCLALFVTSFVIGYVARKPHSERDLCFENFLHSSYEEIDIMSKPIPKISKYMTTTPHTVGKGQTLVVAHTMMHEHQIRHLPVLEGGKLLGLLSDRDLSLIESLKDVDPSKVRVEEAMSQEVYSVSPEASLDEVVLEMASKKYGSAVVMQNNKVVGIFTTVDALRTLGELLHTRLSS